MTDCGDNQRKSHTSHAVTTRRTFASTTAKMARHAQLRLTNLSHAEEAGLDISRVDTERGQSASLVYPSMDLDQVHAASFSVVFRDATEPSDLEDAFAQPSVVLF